MHGFRLGSLISLVLIAAGIFAARAAWGEGDPHKARHIIVIMQENHSFDNYFGALAYAPGSPYHSPGRDDRDERDGGCRQGDHACVDGLTCRVMPAETSSARTQIAMMTAAWSLLSMIPAAAWSLTWTTAGPTRIAKPIAIARTTRFSSR
jgi:phospholipase C